MHTDRIIDAALAIVDSQGADALSMRVLADRLNSGTATLYRHFANRGEVLAHVVDRVFGQVVIDAERLEAADWQQACKAFAGLMFDALERHRNVAALLVEHMPSGPNAMALRELVIAVLLDNGFAPELAARCYATMARFVLGFAVQLTATSGDDDALRRAVGRLDARRFPATVSVADHLPVALDDEFTFGLNLLIAGLTQVHGGDGRDPN
jgi:TetR/AcrR family transcriptional regulator, tetracycline repressor protein